MFHVSFGDRSYNAQLAEIEQPDNNLGVFRVRDANDPVIINLQGIASSSNFAPIKLAGFSNVEKVDFNGVKKFQRTNYNYLRSLQFDEPGEYGSIEKKMSWLVNTEGQYARPYWFEASQCRFGSILFAGTLVKVEMNGNVPREYIKRGTYPAGKTEDIVFYHVEGMPKSLMGIATHASHPYWIVQATAFNNNQVMTSTPRGATHYHCIWNDIDYPSNYADGRLYVPKAFLR